MVHIRWFTYFLIRWLGTSHQRGSIKKGVLRNFTKFTGKHLYQSLFFNKVAGLRPATVLKKRFWYRCFPVNFVKFLRIPILQNTSGRLLPMIYITLDKSQYGQDYLYLTCIAPEGQTFKMTCVTHLSSVFNISRKKWIIFEI